MPIYNYTGNGEGKTSAALGKALRSLGYGKKVVVIQYMKGRKNGEYLFQNRIAGYKVHQFGTPYFIDPKRISENDKNIALQGLEFITEVIKAKPKLLILDEINTAVAYGLLKEDEVVSAIKKIPKTIDTILTGRNAPKTLIEIADYTMEIIEIKRVAVKSAKGLEY